MKDLKRAFGSPDSEFQERVRQTLFRIEEKEETIVKKKLTFSMAMAMILCVCIATLSALAGSALLSEKPDVTQPPLSHSENENPNAAPTGGTVPPDPLLLIDEVYLPENTCVFHIDEQCPDISYPYTALTLSGALDAGGQPCPLCFTGIDGFASLPQLATPTPQPTSMPGPTPVPDYLYDMGFAQRAEHTYIYLDNEYAAVYHLDNSCCGVSSPLQLTLLSAAYMGLSACTECVGDGGFFYASEADPYFHSSADCCVGMDRPLRVTLIEAYALEKIPCHGQAGAPIFVWSSESDGYYHAQQSCSASHSTVHVTIAVAENRCQSPCPFCWTSGGAFRTPTPMPTTESPSSPYSAFPAEVLWPDDSNTYHLEKDCPDLTFPCSMIPLSEAINGSLVPCALCYEKIAADLMTATQTPRQTGEPTPSPMPTEIPEVIYFVATIAQPPLSTQNVKLAPVVYTAQNSSFFHYAPSPACTGEDAVLTLVPLTDALDRDFTPCRECLTCYIGEDSELYHMSESCVRLSSPQIQLVSEAVASGRQPCGVCVCFWDVNNARHHRFARCSAFGDGINAYIPCSLDFPYWVGSAPCQLCTAGSRASALSTPAPMPTTEPTFAERELLIGGAYSDTTVFLWDSNAPVYHSIYNCSGCEYLHQMDLTEAVARELTPCPECMNTEDTVWYSQDSEHYHSHLHYAFLNLPGVIECAPADALADGKRPCENCMLTETAKSDATLGSLPPLWSVGGGEIFFYDYTEGHSAYFHAAASCDAHPMIAPVAISFETAARYELYPCPECTNLSEQVILSEAGGKYYHISDECGRFAAPDYLTRYEAKKLGLTPCADCAYTDIARELTLPTVPPQPTMPPSDDQEALRNWVMRGEAETQCLTDLGYYNQ